MDGGKAYRLLHARPPNPRISDGCITEKGDGDHGF
jgi:hypothetical protein